MNEEKYLPLGSIIIVRGSVKKLMIAGRALISQIQDEKKYFDYACCMYPEGIIGDQAIYVNHEDIDEVVFRGFTDEDDDRMQSNIKKQLEIMDTGK